MHSGAFWKSVKIGTRSASSTLIGEACRGLGGTWEIPTDGLVVGVMLIIDVGDVQQILDLGCPKIHHSAATDPSRCRDLESRLCVQPIPHQLADVTPCMQHKRKSDKHLVDRDPERNGLSQGENQEKKREKRKKKERQKKKRKKQIKTMKKKPQRGTNHALEVVHETDTSTGRENGRSEANNIFMWNVTSHADETEIMGGDGLVPNTAA